MGTIVLLFRVFWRLLGILSYEDIGYFELNCMFRHQTVPSTHASHTSQWVSSQSWRSTWARRPQICFSDAQHPWGQCSHAPVSTPARDTLAWPDCWGPCPHLLQQPTLRFMFLRQSLSPHPRGPDRIVFWTDVSNTLIPQMGFFLSCN